jgi:hypothetical protein
VRKIVSFLRTVRICMIYFILSESFSLPSERTIFGTRKNYQMFFKHFRFVLGLIQLIFKIPYIKWKKLKNIFIGFKHSFCFLCKNVPWGFYQKIHHNFVVETCNKKWFYYSCTKIWEMLLQFFGFLTDLITLKLCWLIFLVNVYIECTFDHNFITRWLITKRIAG